MPDSERDEFLVELFARLSGVGNDEFEESDDWLREIERRLRQVVSGEVVGEDWDVVEQ